MAERALLLFTGDLVADESAVLTAEEALRAACKARGDSADVDIRRQLLERLEERAVVLPEKAFAQIVVAAAPGRGAELKPAVCEALFHALKPRGQLRGAVDSESAKRLLVTGFVRQDGDAGPYWMRAPPVAAVGLKRKPVSQAQAPARVPFVRKQSASESASPPSSDSDDELIDEDELVQCAAAPIQFPVACDVGKGKRRRACKDCTCGMKELQVGDVEDFRRRQDAVLLGRDELAEIDFTVPGKAVGGCGSCALGDAFRCDGCPYLGLPPFRPGEIVHLGDYDDL